MNRFPPFVFLFWTRNAEAGEKGNLRGREKHRISLQEGLAWRGLSWVGKDGELGGEGAPLSRVCPCAVLREGEPARGEACVCPRSPTQEEGQGPQRRDGVGFVGQLPGLGRFSGVFLCVASGRAAARTRQSRRHLRALAAASRAGRGDGCGPHLERTG